MKEFFKKYPALRIVLIALFFVVGMTLVIVGWLQTGKLSGLGLMLVGLLMLILSLATYNKRFQ